MRKILFIYNPCAGTRKIRSKLADILCILSGFGCEFTIFPTSKPFEARDAVCHRDESIDLIICAGGDGTLHEVATGVFLSGWKTPIGYLPAGSTNDYGTSLGLPKNLLKSASLIGNGSSHPCDVGTFNDNIFIYIAAFGLFTDVSYETNQKMKNLLGRMAYLLEGVRRLSKISSCHMRITSETGVLEDEFIFGMITNSLSVGGFKGITGDYVCLDDGLLEVTLIKAPKNPLELTTILAALLSRNLDTRFIYSFQTADSVIESIDAPVAWTLDGEFGGLHNRAHIKVLNHAIDIVR